MSEDFPPEIITCKLKPQEGASGGKSTALSMYWIQRCYSLGTYYSHTLQITCKRAGKEESLRLARLAL